MTDADLILRLRHQADGLHVHATFSSPTWQSSVIERQLPRLDPALLLEVLADREAYGRRLTQMLFADQELVQFVRQARVAAHNNLRLRVDLAAHDTALHSYHWETLFDALGDRDAPICTSERLLFSRYLSNDTFRPVHRSARPEQVKALVVVADPSDLARYQLAQIDVDTEVARIRRALPLPTTILARGADGPPTLAAIAEQLRTGPHILYLVCHGSWRNNTSYLWLEDQEGKLDRVNGSQLIELIAGLQTEQVPLVVVLVSCESMGRGHDAETITALGPQLAAAGVPAVIAMLGPLTMRAADSFVPAFFQALLSHGKVDRAMAAARFTLRAGYEWCIPVLFMRPEDGTLWQEVVGLEDRTRLLHALIDWSRKKYIVAPLHDDLRALADSILNCRSCHEPAMRTKLLQQLQETVDGLDEMIETLRASEHDSPEMRQLDELLPRIDYWPVERRHIADVYALLAQARIDEVDIELLRALYRTYARAPDCPDSDAPAELLKRIIRKLAQKTVQPGKPLPLLEFLLSLARPLQLTSEVRSALEAWCDETARSLGCELNLGVQAHIDAAPTQPTHVEAYLFIAVEPTSPTKADPFTVRALLLPNGADVDKPGSYRPISLNQVDKTYTYAQLPELLTEIVNLTEGELAVESRLMIEIFLPAPLLLRDLDHIYIQVGFEQEYLGVLYPLVVRPLELLAPKAHLNVMRREWQRRWREWKAGQYAVLWLQRQEEYDSRRLLAQLRAGNLTCFASTFIPSDATLAMNMCRYIIQTGVPIALIHRGVSDVSEVYVALEPLLTADAVKMLPQHVLERRKQAQAADSEHHPGHRLTLLWNNPHRCPPVAPLELP
jgi:hypothetical protein